MAFSPPLPLSLSLLLLLLVLFFTHNVTAFTTTITALSLSGSSYDASLYQIDKSGPYSMLYITPGNFKLVQVLVNSVNSMSISATAVDPFYGGAYNPDSISFIDSNPKYLVTARNGIWQAFNSSLVQTATLTPPDPNTASQMTSVDNHIFACTFKSDGDTGTDKNVFSRYDVSPAGEFSSPISQGYLDSNTNDHIQCKYLRNDPILGDAWAYLSNYLSKTLQLYCITGSTPISVPINLPTSNYLPRDFVISNRILIFGSYYPYLLKVYHFGLYQLPSDLSTISGNLDPVKTATISATLDSYSMAYDDIHNTLFVVYPGQIAVFMNVSPTNFQLSYNITLEGFGTGTMTQVKDLKVDPEKGYGYFQYAIDTPASTNIARFPLGDCSGSTCETCTSPYCGWCFTTQKCSPLTLTCPDSPLMYQGNSNGPGQTNSNCPGNTVGTPSPSLSLLDSPELIALTIDQPQFVNIPTLSYTCKFSGISTIETTGTYISSTSISCQDPLDNGYPYTQDEQVQLDIFLGGFHFQGPFDFDLASCSINNYCFLCLASENPCSWCSTTETCVPTSISSSCEEVAVVCNPPTISSISRTSGPISGGTKLVISGSNFRPEVPDITVAGVPCTSIFVNLTSSTISCTTSKTSDSHQGPVSVSWSGLPIANSSDSFVYKEDPTISSISKLTSIAAGGQPIVITGNNFDFGISPIIKLTNITSGSSKRSGYIKRSENLFCSIESFTNTQILCNTNPFSPGTTGTIVIQIDNSITAFESEYSIVSNPVITSFSPVVSCLSGHFTLTIIGTGFLNGDSSILVGNKACMIQSNNGTYITCALPQLDQVKSNTQISVEMWGNKFTPILTINIKSDPVITQFLPAKSSQLSADRGITIVGANFIQDFTTAKIGECPCSIQSVEDTIINCILAPCEASGPIIVTTGSYTVQSQENFEISAASDGNLNSPNTNTAAIIGGAVGGGLGFLIILALILVLFFVYKKKHSTLAVKKREQVKDAAAYVFVAFKDSNADASEKVLKDLETQINGLLDSNEMEIFEVFNSLPQGEQVMKAIGLLLLEKENLLTIFNHFSHKEVEKSEDPQRLFRGPDVCSRIFRSVLKPIAFNYYWNLLGPIIDLLTDSDVVVTEEKLSRAASDVKMMNETDIEMFELNVYKTQLVSHTLIAAIMKSKNTMPDTLREILRTVGKHSFDRFGKDCRNNSITTFLILRFLSAILMTPQPYNILTEKQKKLSEATTTSLSNLSSITVKIASSKEFSDRDGKLAELNPFIRSHIPKFHNFYDELMNAVSPGHEMNAVVSLPKHVKNLALVEISNGMLSNKEKFTSITNPQLSEKINEFYESNPKSISPTNKNFNFSNY